MMATWSRAEMLRTPMKRVTAIPYSCVKRKMRGEGRGPATENRRNSTHITITAGAVGSENRYLLLGMQIYLQS